MQFAPRSRAGLIFFYCPITAHEAIQAEVAEGSTFENEIPAAAGPGLID